MSEQEIKVPDLGGADEVEVIEIIASEGDTVQEEDPILTVETDKATVELPSPAAGKISKITAKVGDKIKEGDVVGMLVASDDSGDSGDSEEDSGSAGAESKAGADEKSEAKSEDCKPEPKKQSGGSRTERVKVPSLDGMEDIPVIEINVSEGDTVAVDDPLVTVESDKATMEIPSPFAGKVSKILVKEGDKLSEDADLLDLVIEDEGGEPDEAESTEEKSPKKESTDQSESTPDAKPEKQEDSSAESATYAPPSPGAKVHAGPAVRKLARELGADLT
ncbi:MAG: biotin/lipoyl-containing protein, partial [Marinobacter sp.]|uniref:biotin/lipoyl-containing protein n=1 Tax=Marinobacter sp. TaxID=50741 RepID=UPI00329724DF